MPLLLATPSQCAMPLPVFMPFSLPMLEAVTIHVMLDVRM